MLDKNGNLLNKREVEARWTEHFKEVLNKCKPENPVLSDEVHESKFNDIIEEISVSEPPLGEVKEATKRLKNGKAPGTDSTTAELLKENRVFSNKNPSIVGKSMEVWEDPPTLEARANYQVAEKRKSQRMQTFERNNPTVHFGEGTR